MLWNITPTIFVAVRRADILQVPGGVHQYGLGPGIEGHRQDVAEYLYS